MPSDNRDWPAEIARVKGDGWSRDGRMRCKMWDRGTGEQYIDGITTAHDARDALIDALAAELAAADEDYDRIEAERDVARRDLREARRALGRVLALANGFDELDAVCGGQRRSTAMEIAGKIRLAVEGGR